MFGIPYKDGFLCEIRFVSIHKIIMRFFGGAIPLYPFSYCVLCIKTA